MSRFSKILVCSGRLWHYPKAIADGFRELGCDVRLVEYPTTNILKLERSSFWARIHPWFCIRHINRKILNEAKLFSPDLVLVVNGEEILPETVAQIALKTPIVHWAVDGVKNLKTRLEVFKNYTKNYVFEPIDALSVSNAKYLPLGADLKIYRPYELPKKYDVSFVGAPHPNRLAFLEKIAVVAQGKFNFCIFGPFQKVDVEQFPNLASCIIKNEKLDPAEIAKIYSQSKISLNPHHEQSKEGLNPRVFEMAACGTLELCSNQKYLEKFFPNQEIVSYNDIDDLLKKIDFYLKNEHERTFHATAAQKIVRQKYSLKECAAQMLCDVEKLDNSNSNLYVFYKPSSLWNYMFDGMKDNCNVKFVNLDEFPHISKFRKKLLNWGLGKSYYFSKKLRCLLRNIRPQDRFLMLGWPTNSEMCLFAKLIPQQTKKYFWIWNSLETEPHPEKMKKRISIIKNAGFEISTFDDADVKKYGLVKLNQFFRVPEKLNVTENLKTDFYFLGKSKGREENLSQLKKLISSLKMNADFKIIERGGQEISYEENLNRVAGTRCLVEIIQKGQHGLSLRALEALFLDKKLITSNPEIAKEPFYRPENIYICSNFENLEFEKKRVLDFLNTPQLEIPEEIKQKYLFSNWFAHFIN